MMQEGQMLVGVTTMGCDAGRSGISTYLLRLLEHLDRLGGPERYELISLRRELQVWTPGLRMGAVGVSDGFGHPVANVAWHQLFLPSLCKRRAYDVLLLPAASRRAPVRSCCPTVGVVHDFSHLHVRGKYDAARTFYQSQLVPRILRRLDHVITISESSKRDVIEHGGVPDERITVIPHGVDHQVYRPAASGAPAPTSLPGMSPGAPYVLYVSRLEHPAKNHVALIKAFDRFKARAGSPHQLVLAGADWHGSAEIHAAIAAAKHRDDIVLLGFVPTAALPDLYRAASLFAFPSRYEGFGLPILEAMACGAPVACSNVSSMPEVAGDAAILFDPEDIDEIEGALERVLLDETTRRDLAERGLQRAACYSWDTTARRTREVLARVAGRA